MTKAKIKRKNGMMPIQFLAESNGKRWNQLRVFVRRGAAVLSMLILGCRRGLSFQQATPWPLVED